MRTYFDTSILLKIYVREENSPLALALITAEENPIPFSHLLELELKTAIRIKHGRGEISLVEQRGALKAIEEDFSNGVLAELAGLVALPKTTIEIRQHESLAGSLICGRQMVGKRHPGKGVE